MVALSFAPWVIKVTPESVPVKGYKRKESLGEGTYEVSTLENLEIKVRGASTKRLYVKPKCRMRCVIQKRN